MNPLQKLKDDARAEVAYIVLNRDCTCGFGEKRGTQCDCGFEVRQSTYLSHRFLDTLIEKVVAAVEEEVVPEEALPSDWDDDDKPRLRARMFNDCRDVVLQAFRNFRTHE